MSHAAAPRRLSLTQVLGELFITVGVLFFLFAFYESYWTNLEASREQSKVSDKLDQQWQHVNPRQKLTPELGEAFARMYIPAFGSDFHFAIVEGTTDADLLAGPGRYTESQLPGDPGNFAVAGHRVGKGAPFNDLGNLKVCDQVDEGGGARAGGESHGGGRGEGLLARGQVEGDVVAGHMQEVGAGGGFLSGQVLTGHRFSS